EASRDGYHARYRSHASTPTAGTRSQATGEARAPTACLPRRARRLGAHCLRTLGGLDNPAMQRIDGDDETHDAQGDVGMQLLEHVGADRAGELLTHPLIDEPLAHAFVGAVAVARGHAMT